MKGEGALEIGEPSRALIGGAPYVNKDISIFDFILRVVAIIGTLASAIAMGTSHETLPFFTQFIHFKAKYSDLPSFTFFVVANSIVFAYLVFTLPLSILHVIRSTARNTRLFLVLFDTVMLALLTSGASAATSIVYLVHTGDATANWFSICRQFHSFCELFWRHSRVYYNHLLIGLCSFEALVNVWEQKDLLLKCV
ncbi:hypothetical protein QJS10_CPA06g00462 [Acorus calamus]|uniref:CASP-like protein n=1 Tax=Acorus calamus TaxID=4465 RepID=A0AAV9EJ43_ACOCL|nr:hypothetical protein QJS10_CPA06g00462 [Acorus calamus]